MANTLHDALFGPQAGREDTFLHLADGGTLSHAGFSAMAARLAHAISAAGLAPGDRLAAQVPKSAEALALYAACVRAGVIFLPLNTAYTGDELDYFVGDSGAGVLVCDPGRAEALAPLAGAHGAALLTLGAAGEGKIGRAHV